MNGLEVSVRHISVVVGGSVVVRGITDKKLTSTLVIRTFLSFELADIF